MEAHQMPDLEVSPETPGVDEQSQTDPPPIEARAHAGDNDTAAAEAGAAVPVAEAIASVMQQTAHQHAAAHDKEEDAPQEPIQRRLPIPRPAFDYCAALIAIANKEEHVARLAGRLETAAKAHKAAKSEWEDASHELAAMVRQSSRAMLESEREPEPQQADLPHGAECSWERDHPNEVCGVCQAARDAVRAKQHAEVAEQLAADASAEPESAAPPDGPTFLVKRVRVDGDVDERPEAYLTADDAAEMWTVDVSLACVFSTREDAQAWIDTQLTTGGAFEVMVDPMWVDPNAAAAVSPADALPELPAEEASAQDFQPLEGEPAIVVGSLAIARLAGPECWEAGEAAVCYEVYEIDGRPGYSFIFEKKFSDGFSLPEIRSHLTITGTVAQDVADYQFRNAVNLNRDYRKGVFQAAFAAAKAFYAVQGAQS